jgi:hypothetical protein
MVQQVDNLIFAQETVRCRDRNAGASAKKAGNDCRAKKATPSDHAPDGRGAEAWVNVGFPPIADTRDPWEVPSMIRLLFALAGAILLSSCAAPRTADRITSSNPELEAAGGGAVLATDPSLIELQASLGYVWHSRNAGRSVQYGVPETDDRAFRADCANGRLLIVIPDHPVEAEDAVSSALFSNGERREGRIEDLGDGANLVITTALDDPIVATLFSGNRIAIDTPNRLVRVPTAGSAHLLRALIDACRRQGSQAQVSR